jgi:hypothetical protein
MTSSKLMTRTLGKLDEALISHGSWPLVTTMLSASYKYPEIMHADTFNVPSTAIEYTIRAANPFLYTNV